MKSLSILIAVIFSVSRQQKTTEIELNNFLNQLNILLLKKNVIQSNILNRNTTRTEKGGPYIPVEAINCKESGCDITPVKMTGAGSDLGQNRIPIMKYEPNHPDSDKNGYVAYPNINIEEEKSKLQRVTTAISFLMKTMPVKESFFFSEKAQKFLSKYPEVDREYNFKKLLAE